MIMEKKTLRECAFDAWMQGFLRYAKELPDFPIESPDYYRKYFNLELDPGEAIERLMDEL